VIVRFLADYLFGIFGPRLRHGILQRFFSASFDIAGNRSDSRQLSKPNAAIAAKEE